MSKESIITPEAARSLSGIVGIYGREKAYISILALMTMAAIIGIIAATRAGMSLWLVAAMCN